MSAFEADRFNHSRTSPESSCKPSTKSRFLRPSRSLGGRNDNHYLLGRQRKTKRLSTTSKERLQHFGAAAGQHSAANLDPVVQLRMIQNLHHRMHGPGLGVVRAVYQALHAGMHQGAGAHRARLNCNKQSAVFETMVTNGCTGLAQRDDLGVGGRVVVGDVAVPSSAYNSVVAKYNRADRDISRFEGALGAAQGFLHPELVRMKLVRGGPGSGVFGLTTVGGCFFQGHAE